MTYFVNMISMSENEQSKQGQAERKKERVLASAQEVFIRYGFRRTTMGDLAQAAEVSRPALYLLYANKEDIFRAVVERYCRLAENRAEERMAEVSGVSHKLEQLMLTWVVDPYVEISQSPEAGEIYEAGYSFAVDLKERFTEIYLDQIKKVLALGHDAQSGSEPAHKLSSVRVAELLAHSSLGLKREARDLDHLQALLADMRICYLSVLGY